MANFLDNFAENRNFGPYSGFSNSVFDPVSNLLNLNITFMNQTKSKLSKIQSKKKSVKIESLTQLVSLVKKVADFVYF